MMSSKHTTFPDFSGRVTEPPGASQERPGDAQTPPGLQFSRILKANMGPCCHPTRTNTRFCVEDADMHLTLGFLSSNTIFGVSLAAYLRHKTHQKKRSGTACLLEPYFFKYFLDFAAILGANMTPKTSPRLPNSPPEATQEPLKSTATPPMSHAKQPSTLAQSVQDRQEAHKPRK